MCGGGKTKKKSELYCPIVACDCMLPPPLRAKVRQSYNTYSWGQNPVVQIPCPGSEDYRSWWCKQLRRQMDICTTTDNWSRTASTSYDTNQTMTPQHSQVCWCTNPSRSVGSIPSFTQSSAHNETDTTNTPQARPGLPTTQVFDANYKSLPNIPRQQQEQNQLTSEIEVQNWTMERNYQNNEDRFVTEATPQTFQQQRLPYPNLINSGNSCTQAGGFGGNVTNGTGNTDFNVNSTPVQKKGRWCFRDFLSRKTHSNPAPQMDALPKQDLGNNACRCCYPPAFSQICAGMKNGTCNCGSK